MTTLSLTADGSFRSFAKGLQLSKAVHDSTVTPLSRRNAGLTAWLLGAVLATYGFTLGFGFVFDNHVQVERNPWLRSPDGLRLFLTRPFSGFNRQQSPLSSNS